MTRVRAVTKPSSLIVTESVGEDRVTREILFGVVNEGCLYVKRVLIDWTAASGEWRIRPRIRFEIEINNRKR